MHKQNLNKRTGGEKGEKTANCLPTRATLAIGSWFLIIILTDHKKLTSHTNNFSKKVNCWETELGELQIEYKFIEGEIGNVPDKLSREINSLEIRTNGEIMEEKNQENSVILYHQRPHANLQ